MGVSYTPGEFVLDFGRTLPGQRSLKVLSRLLMSPVGAKMFYRALGTRLARYEAAFGRSKCRAAANLPWRMSYSAVCSRPIRRLKNNTGLRSLRTGVPLLRFGAGAFNLCLLLV